VSIKSGACAVAICLASSAASAQPMPMGGPMAGLGPVLPPQEIGRILRAHGLVPQATPVRNGEAYQVRAIDRLGRQVRVAVDARYGDILFTRPIVMVPPGGYGPYGPPPGAMPPYYGGPPPSTVGAYPPAPGVRPTPPLPERAAALTPVHPPIPRPKPAAKPADLKPTPATPPDAAATTPAPAAAPPPPAADAPATAPAATPSAIPPVAPLD
jgi:hypothetical protein